MNMRPPNAVAVLGPGSIFSIVFFGFVFLVVIGFFAEMEEPDQRPYYLGYEGDLYNPSESNADGSSLVFTGDGYAFVIDSSQKSLGEQVSTTNPRAVEVQVGSETPVSGYFIPGSANEASTLGVGAGTTQFVGHYYPGTSGMSREDEEAAWESFIDDLYLSEEPTFMYGEVSSESDGLPVVVIVTAAVISVAATPLLTWLLVRRARVRRSNKDWTKFLAEYTNLVSDTSRVKDRRMVGGSLLSISHILWDEEHRGEVHWYDSPAELLAEPRIATYRPRSNAMIEWMEGLLSWGVSTRAIPPSRMFREAASQVNSISHARSLVIANTPHKGRRPPMATPVDGIVVAAAWYLSRIPGSGNSDYRRAISVLAEVASKVDFLAVSEDGHFFVVDSPKERHFDDLGRLHNDDGPAVVYEGQDVYAVRGVVVPKSVFDGTITVEEAMQERNSEVRRIAIEKIGWEHFTESAGFRLIDQAADPGNPGQRLRLFELPVDMPDSEINRVLVCVNGTVEKDGTRRTFGQLVPCEISDAVGAAAWTYGLDKEEYLTAARRA